MAKIPLYYTFGNHMHWVDMQWLWGYHVLPGSIRDMLHFCRETGARGNVNFDGIGYEKLAAEDPEALAELREAVQNGTIEPVGCSYGQPYGLFHGGESNIRQRIYGARTVRRLLGVWPKTFWEEEFDFFPQLPQMLRGCGFEYASLFFQWTWHTPEIPKEEVPVIWWEGQDGSKLLCATRSKLNLHQWPEDMDATFAELATSPPTPDTQSPTPLILQWLELMPSPDWMCRSELLLPKMHELLSDERFEIKSATLGGYLQQSIPLPPATLPTRKYSMDDVWHGMSLGKNTDSIRRKSFDAESGLLEAESLAAILSLFGRPYAQWDVYPTWELEEQWRNLLMAQHHDNDECEGLCGHVGHAQYDLAISEAFGVRDRLIDRVLDDFNTPGDVIWVYNPLGWSRKWHVIHREHDMTVVDVPPLGWTVVPMDAPDIDCGSWQVEGKIARFRRGALKVDVDLEAATVTHFANASFPNGIPLGGKCLWEWCGSDAEGNPLKLVGREKIWDSERDAPSLVGDRWLRVPVEFVGHPGTGFTIGFGCEPHHEGLEIQIFGTAPRPKAGLNEAFGFTLPLAQAWSQIVSDEPYGVTKKNPTGRFLKKYPEGDWMTSPQWFETIEQPFTSSTFVDLQEPGSNSGMQISHDGARQWFGMGDGSVRHILHAYDPWDEERDNGHMDNFFRFVPHLAQSNSQLWRQAQEAHRECREEAMDAPGSKLPSEFSALFCDSPNVIPTAFYRETEDFSGKHVENYAGKGMGYPFVVRLVEFDGLETEATLTVAGTVARAYKTNHLGQVLEEITDGLKVKMRPYEIATIYIDIVEGRKQTRDLDAKREIWATVHRVE